MMLVESDDITLDLTTVVVSETGTNIVSCVTYLMLENWVRFESVPDILKVILIVFVNTSM